MSTILEKSLIENPALALDCSRLSEETSILCSSATLSVCENNECRLDWISAIEAYQAQGLNLLLLWSSWNQLSIASYTIFKSAVSIVWSQVDEGQLVLNCPAVIAITQAEQASVVQMERLLDLVHASPHPVKILAFQSNAQMLAPSMNPTPAVGDLKRVLAAQGAIASAKKIDQQTQAVASTVPRPRRRI